MVISAVTVPTVFVASQVMAESWSVLAAMKEYVGRFETRVVPLFHWMLGAGLPPVAVQTSRARDPSV